MNKIHFILGETTNLRKSPTTRFGALGPNYTEVAGLFLNKSAVICLTIKKKQYMAMCKVIGLQRKL